MTDDINAVIERVREWYWLPDQDRADRDAVIAHIDALTRSRNEAWSAVHVRDIEINATVKKLTIERNEARRKCSDEIERNIEANNRAIAAAEATRARCEKIAREGSFPFDIDVWLNATKKEMTAHAALAIAIADAIAALKVESAPAPRDAEIAALREALDDAESWIERHQEGAHDGAEWASLLTKIDRAMRASAALTAPCSTCGRTKDALEKIDAALAKGSQR